MGTEYETKVILDMMIDNLEVRRKLYDGKKEIQEVIDDIIKSIETVRNGRKTHETRQSDSERGQTMGTEYEFRIFFDLIISSLKNRKKNADDAKVQKEIDEIIEEIEAARDGRTTHEK